MEIPSTATTDPQPTVIANGKICHPFGCLILLTVISVLPDRKLNEEFLDGVFALLKKIILECKTGEGPVIDFQTPTELVKRIDLSLPLHG